MAPKAGTTAPATDDVDAMFGDSDGTGGANLRQFRAVEPNSEVRATSSA